MPTNLTARLSSLLLSTSLLITAACSTTTRAGADAGISGPIHAVKVQPRAADPADDLDRAAVKAKLLERRTVMKARFLAYRDSGVYPINTYEPGLAHVWVDVLGNLCAAATMISGDWGYDPTIAAVDGNLFIALADVKDGALADWMLTSGLTHSEIVAIQEPGFMGRMEPEPRPQLDPAEAQRLYAIYTSVERQIDSLWDESLDEAVDALMKHPELARRFLAGELPTAPAKTA